MKEKEHVLFLKPSRQVIFNFLQSLFRCFNLFICCQRSANAGNNHAYCLGYHKNIDHQITFNFPHMYVLFLSKLVTVDFERCCTTTTISY